MDEYRVATLADVMKRMQEEPRYERYSVPDMGWGMGNAQIGIEPAVREAEALGLVTTEKNHADWKLMASLTEAGKAWKGPAEENTVQDTAWEIRVHLSTTGVIRSAKIYCHGTGGGERHFNNDYTTLADVVTWANRAPTAREVEFTSSDLKLG